MIADVTLEKTVYQGIPHKFEAGTGNIADAVGLGAARDYVGRIGLDYIARHEHALLAYGMRALAGIPGLRLIGTAADRASVMSFVLDGYTTDQVGSALNGRGIAVRTGHHCAQPILRRFGVETTVRPSLAFYHTFDRIAAWWRWSATWQAAPVLSDSVLRRTFGYIDMAPTSWLPATLARQRPAAHFAWQCAPHSHASKNAETIAFFALKQCRM